MVSIMRAERKDGMGELIIREYNGNFMLHLSVD